MQNMEAARHLPVEGEANLHPFSGMSTSQSQRGPRRGAPFRHPKGLLLRHPKGPLGCRPLGEGEYGPSAHVRPLHACAVLSIVLFALSAPPANCFSASFGKATPHEDHDSIRTFAEADVESDVAPEEDEIGLATSFGTIIGVSTETPGRKVADDNYSDTPIRYSARGLSRIGVQSRSAAEHKYQVEYRHPYGSSPAINSDAVTQDQEDVEWETPGKLQQQQQQLASATVLRLSNIVLRKVEGQDRRVDGVVAHQSQSRTPSGHFNGVRELQKIQAALMGIGYSEFADFLNSKEARRFFKPILHHHRITILAPSDYAMLPLPNDCEFGATDDEHCRRDVIRRRRSQLAASLQWHVLMGQFVGQQNAKGADEGQENQIPPPRRSRRGANQGRCGQTIAEADLFVDKQVSIHGLDCILDSQVIQFSDEPRMSKFG